MSDLWVNQMTSPDDHLLLLNEKDNGFGRFRNPSFNFDSAAYHLYGGCDQTIRKRITIERMADGKPFEMDKQYRAAVNPIVEMVEVTWLTKEQVFPKQNWQSVLSFQRIRICAIT